MGIRTTMIMTTGATTGVNIIRRLVQEIAFRRVLSWVCIFMEYGCFQHWLGGFGKARSMIPM